MIINLKYRIKIKIQNISNLILKYFGFVLSEIKLSHISIAQKIFRQKKDLIIIDIGANKGQFIEKCLSNLKNFQIYAFEPQSHTFNFLKKKYKNKKNVNLFKNAIGSKEENLEFYVNKRSQSSGFYKFQKDFKFKNFENENIAYDNNEIVNVKTLDKFCEENAIKNINILKIDTECHEDLILNGATNLLKNSMIDMIDIEIIVGKIYSKRLSFFEIEQILHPYNYRLFSIDNKGNRIDKRHLLFNVLYVSEKIDRLY